MRSFIEKVLSHIWYQPSVKWYLFLFIPLSFLTKIYVTIKRKLYLWNILKTKEVPVPVIVVGNITVGGTGKTPVTIYISKLLQKHNFKPGIICRGYLGKAKNPLVVEKNSSHHDVGDEALLLTKLTDVPVAIGKNRVKAAELLLKNYDVDIIISDDGLQHYKLARNIEIAVIDGQRELGNNSLLPIGPLREPKERLNSVDICVANGGLSMMMNDYFLMRLQLVKLYNCLDNTKELEIYELSNKTVHAVSGIGNPAKFFDLLKLHNITVIPHAYSDHHKFSKEELEFNDNYPIIITEKDSVKCMELNNPNIWVLSVQACLSKGFDEKLLSLLGVA